MARRISGDLSDPDPFGWGISLLSALFSGASYLETRRQSRITVEEREGRFRRAWFSARRTVIHSRRIVEEFATYVEELGFGSDEFRFGGRRLDLPREVVRDLRRLHANCLMNATHLADDLDDLSEFLDSAYGPAIKLIQDRLTEAQMPHTYDAIVYWSEMASPCTRSCYEWSVKRKSFNLSG